MKIKNLLWISFLLLCPVISVIAQTDEEPVLDFRTPAEYEVAQVNLTGVQHLDIDIIRSISGLRVGDKITIPGDDISKAIQNLWRQGLFTNVQIYIDSIVSGNVYLDIRVQERPRLARFNFTGVKKVEADELRDRLQLIRGRVVSENVKLTAVNSIESYFRNKGYYNTSITTSEKPDTLISNSILLTFDVDKGQKVKIEQIEFSGVENASVTRLKRAMKDTREKAKIQPGKLLNLQRYREVTGAEDMSVAQMLGSISPSGVYAFINDRMNINIFASSKFLESDYRTDKESIVKYYHSKGFRDARIVEDSVYFITPTDLKISIHIDEGQRYYFRNITWKGNTKYTSEQLDAILGIQKGEIYNSELLDTRLFMNPQGVDVSSLYMDDGYLFFQVTPMEVQVEEDSIDLEIRVYEGPQATINEIRITGNTKTNEHVIRRELRTLPGAKFSRADLIRSQREIANLGFFDPEQIGINPQPNPERGTVDIEYIVVEKPSDQLELSAGWGGSGRGVVGTLGVNFTNFSIRNITNLDTWGPLPSGDGQRFSIRFQANGRQYQSYNISFTEPWLGGKRPNALSVAFYKNRIASYDFETNELEGKLVTNGASLGLGTRLRWPDDYFTFSPSLNFQNFQLDNWRSSDFIITDGFSNNFSLQLVLARNSIDQPIYPRRGSRLSVSLQVTPPYSSFSNKDYTTLSDNEKFKWIEYHKWKFNAEWFTPLVGNLVLRASAKFGFLGLYNPDIGISPFERFELGGDGISNYTFYGRDIISLRGYDVITPAIGAPVYDKFTIEMRYPFSLNPSATIYALAFMEGGNHWGSFSDFNPFQVRRSAGLGMRIFLPMFGMLGFDYGIGFDKPLGRPTSFGDLLNKYGKFSIVLGFEPE